jgi:outer membrane beta-barrel protein
MRTTLSTDLPMKTLAPLLTAILAACLLAPATASAAKRKTDKSATTEKREVKVEEVGVLRNEDVRVVQKNLFTKKGHHEIGFLISTTPLDTYVVGLHAGLDVTFNPSERLGIELLVQGGYGFANGHYQDISALGEALGGTLTGLASDTARDLFGGGLNLVWSPIYGKFAWGSRKVVRFDVYGTLGGHGYLAQRLDPPTEDVADSLTGHGGPSIGLGVKLHLSQAAALKIDVRDNLSIEQRAFTGDVTVRSVFQIGVGIAFYPTRAPK